MFLYGYADDAIDPVDESGDADDGQDPPVDASLHREEHIAKYIGHGVDQGVVAKGGGEIQSQQSQQRPGHAAAGAGDAQKIHKDTADPCPVQDPIGQEKIKDHSQKQQKPAEIPVAEVFFHGDAQNLPK